MAKKNNPPQRVYNKLIDDMEKLMDFRIKNNLMTRKEAKIPEITELLTRTEGYQLSLQELKTKPKRRNGK